MLQNILDILGRGYTPITYEYTESVYDASLDAMSQITNDIIPSGMAGVDWEFLAAAAIFCVCLYCIFRLLGAIFK